jgi:hypothetical protein
MQQHHLAIMRAKQHATDAATAQLTSYLPKTVAERAAKWHPYRPRKLDVFNVFANRLSIDSIA